MQVPVFFEPSQRPLSAGVSVQDSRLETSKTSRGVDLQAFKKRIQQAIEQLEAVADSSQAAAEPVELDQTRMGRLSRMDALQGQAMAKASEGRRQAQLTALKQALIRLDAGEYGFCLRCGEPINPARLASNLAVTLCIECATADE